MNTAVEIDFFPYRCCFVTFEKFSMGKVFAHLKHFKDVGWVGVPMTKSTKTAGKQAPKEEEKTFSCYPPRSLFGWC